MGHFDQPGKCYECAEKGREETAVCRHRPSSRKQCLEKRCARIGISMSSTSWPASSLITLTTRTVGQCFRNEGRRTGEVWCNRGSSIADDLQQNSTAQTTQLDPKRRNLFSFPSRSTSKTLVLSRRNAISRSLACCSSIDSFGSSSSISIVIPRQSFSSAISGRTSY